LVGDEHVDPLGGRVDDREAMVEIVEPLATNRPALPKPTMM